MGKYVRGDVILAPVPFEERHGSKTRPAVVLVELESGTIQVCPISSRPPSDSPSLAIAIDDFTEGGLDLFTESYAILSKLSTIRTSEVICLKGRLTQEVIDTIVSQAGAKKDLRPHVPKKKIRR